MFRTPPGPLPVFVSLLIAGLCSALADDIVFRDNFDTDNALDSAPAGWILNKAVTSDDRMRVVGEETIEPASAPYCIELADDSTADQGSNPFVIRDFSPVRNGRLSCKVFIPLPKAAPSTVELWEHDREGNQLAFRMNFDSNGRLEYAVGGGRGGADEEHATSTQWMPGRWQELEILWKDGKATAKLDGQVFADKVPIVVVPSRIKFRTGGDSIFGRKAYFDDVALEEIRN